MARALPPLRRCRPGGAALLGAGHLAQPGRSPPRPSGPRAAVDPKLVDEMAADLVRYADEVTGFRRAARSIIKRTYHEKVKAIREKYEPLIVANEKEEKERRVRRHRGARGLPAQVPDRQEVDAGRDVPSGRALLREVVRRVPDRAGEPTRRRSTRPIRPTAPPPKADYTPTVNLYRRLLIEFPNYRLLDATYYLLGFCLGEMGQEPEARQALLGAGLRQPVSSRSTRRPSSRPSTGHGQGADRRLLQGAARRSRRSRSSCPRPGRASARCTSTPPELRLGDLGVQPGADVQGFALLRQGHLQAGVVVLPRQPLHRRGSRVRRSGQVGRQQEGGRATSSAPTCGPRRCSTWASASPSPTGTATRLPDPETGPAARAGLLPRPREASRTSRRSSSAWATSTSTRPSTPRPSPSTSTSWRRGPSSPTHRKLQDKVVKALRARPQPGGRGQRARDPGPHLQQGQRVVPAEREQPGGPGRGRPARRGRPADRGHQRARRGAGLPGQGAGGRRAKKLDECQEAYRTAAELYEKYLAAYPELEARLRVLGLLRRRPLLRRQGRAVDPRLHRACATRNVDNRYQQDAALQVIKALRGDHRATASARSASRTRPSPTRRTPSRRSAALPMHELYKKYMEALDWYVGQPARRARARPALRRGGHHCSSYRSGPRRAPACREITEPTATASPTSASRPTTPS